MGDKGPEGISVLRYSPWSVAFLPTFVLLGVALPITFLAFVDRYLYYLRPVELIPTYGTAWLFLAAPCVPLSLLFGLALKTMGRSSGWRGVRAGLTLLLVAVAATELVGAFASGAMVWLRTFGLLSKVHVIDALSAGSVVAGCIVALLRAGRETLMNYFGAARFAAIVGLLSLLSLPFFVWNSLAPGPVNHLAAVPTAGVRPNILLLTFDALAADHMSLYGATRLTTPDLDAFAHEATVFDRVFSNGNFTTPAISSLLTATRPWTHRALQLQAWPEETARSNSLPAALERSGYQTAYVGTSPWAGATRLGLGSYFSFHYSDAYKTLGACRDGFSAVLPYDCAATELAPFIFAEVLLGKVWSMAFDKPPNWGWDPRMAIEPALHWLESADKRTPIFLWVHIMPPHSPYAAPAPWLGTFDASDGARTAADSESEEAYLFSRVSKERAHLLAARYDESIKYVDHFAGNFLRQSLPLLGDNTIVIVTSDHGESFTHGYGLHRGPGLYESLIHIPLIIKLPHQLRGKRTSFLAEQIDIAPTVAAVAGLSPSPNWEGRSLLAVADPSPADASMPETPVFSMNFEENHRQAALDTGSVAVIEGKWKLVHYMGALHYRLMPQLHDELYDLSKDPNEVVNRISDYPNEAERLRGLIGAQLARHGDALP